MVRDISTSLRESRFQTEMCAKVNIIIFKLQCFIVAKILESLGELSQIFDHILSLTEAAIEMFLENGCTFYDKQITLLNIVL